MNRDSQAGEDVSFKVGDKVKFKKSSVNSGMIYTTENDVFHITSVHTEHWGTVVKLNGIIGTVSISHLEHVKEEIMNSIEEQEIKWEIGQEVWCLLRGKGVVESVESHRYGILVKFEDTSEGYTKEGKLYAHHKHRSLFFSEPKIEAEKFPLKKPFSPTLKKDQWIVVHHKHEGYTNMFKVVEELEDAVISGGIHYKKALYTFRNLGDEIVFN